MGGASTHDMCSQKRGQGHGTWLHSMISATALPPRPSARVSQAPETMTASVSSCGCRTCASMDM